MILTVILSVILNLTESPDRTKTAFTRDNDLYVVDIATSDTTRLTFDGSAVIGSGYASWVYYEEILGRSSNYKAFWWSPDSKKIAYYRFDDSKVTMFPIYSPFDTDGSYTGTLRQTRYPKAGGNNPTVQVKIADLLTGKTTTCFEGDENTYYGKPFWGADSKELFVSVMPRRQSRLDLYAASALDGSHRLVYHEEYPTWIEWIEGMLFTDKGLYMARDFESGWQQIYFLGYDGSLKKLTSGENWGVNLLKVDTKRNTLWFTAKRDSRLHPSLYKLDLRTLKVTSLTDPEKWIRNVEIDDNGDFTAEYSTANSAYTKIHGNSFGRKLKVEVDGMICYMVKGGYPKVQTVTIENDGFTLYGLMTLPKDFDPAKKYPVVMEVYGGPGTAYVRDRWGDRDATNRWCWENGIIYMVVDPRTAGENGRKGMDQAFRRMTVVEQEDYIAWAKYLQSLPYVDGGHIGVDGFSFGGTTTAFLVLCHPEYFHCGIAGGGVYDWHFYDSHYTERYMCTPAENPEGYDTASAIRMVQDKRYSKDYQPYHLKLTHGTGDDNVHFQSTLRFMDALQKEGLKFELMLYPDAMHGYGKVPYQRDHDQQDAHNFWLKYLYD